MKDKDISLALLIVGAVGSLAFLLQKAKLDGDVLREGQGAIGVEYTVGFWVVFACFLSVIGLNAFILSQRTKEKEIATQA